MRALVALVPLFACTVSCSLFQKAEKSSGSGTSLDARTPPSAQSGTLGDRGYYQRNDGKERVVIFVHGIYGDALSTWKCTDGRTSWPGLMAGDDSFRNSDIYVVDYPSPKTGNMMTIDQEVGNIMNRLKAVIDSHNEVVFLVHSLGGLITQKMLLIHREIAPKVKFIYFFSTPEEGAQIAQLGHALNDDPLLKQMFHGDANTDIESIETEWINAKFAMPRYCAYERQKTNGFLVVDRLSATRLCNQDPVPLYADHISIVKPCDRNNGSYVAFKNAYHDNPVRKASVVPREWKSYQQVDCERTNSNHALEASITLDPRLHEVVDGAVTVRFDGSVDIQGAAIKVVSQSGDKAVIDYGFNGRDKSFGNCPGGGHTTIVATFPVRQEAPID